MLRHLLIISTFSIPFFALSQERLPYTVDESDTSRFLFEYQLFYTGSERQIDLNYRYVMEHLVNLLMKHPEWKVHVRGHVCCGPSDKLSHKRAKTVYRFLKRAGIDKTRVSYKGYSDLMPMAFPEDTEDDERLNRRVDFVISYH